MKKKTETIVAVRTGPGEAVTFYAFPTAAKARDFAKEVRKSGWEAITGQLPPNGKAVLAWHNVQEGGAR